MRRFLAAIPMLGSPLLCNDKSISLRVKPRGPFFLLKTPRRHGRLGHTAPRCSMPPPRPTLDYRSPPPTKRSRIRWVVAIVGGTIVFAAVSLAALFVVGRITEGMSILAQAVGLIASIAVGAAAGYSSFSATMRRP